MLIARNKSELKAYLAPYKNATIGFVPTMGALHEGHISLIERSKSTCDITVCSIFVNPLQFNNSEDYAKYPITIEADIEKLQANQCDILYLPSTDEIYPEKTLFTVDVGIHNTWMEGANRPGHFSGVVLVLSKLFHAVTPNVVFMGQKDFQQCLVVKQMIKDLGFDIQLCTVDTVREPSGLAMSSRNQRLTPYQTQRAVLLSQTLFAVINKIKNNPNNYLQHIETEAKKLTQNPEIKLEYLEIADANTGTPIQNILPNNTYCICIAAYIGEVRLIDNMIFNV